MMVQASAKSFLIALLLGLCLTFASNAERSEGLISVEKGDALEGQAASVLPIGQKELRRLEPVSDFSNVPPPRLRRRYIDEDELDYDEDDDDEGPDFWDVVVWFGSQIGRALKLLLVALGKLAYTIYVGIAYGWHEAEHTTTKPLLDI